MRNEHGFSLVELMIALTLAVILLALATPSWLDLIQNNRITSQAQEFIRSLHLARSEALKRGTAVAICPSSTGTACTDSSDWSQGWIVFSDIGGTIGAYDSSANDEIINVHGELEGNLRLNSSDAGDKFIRFDEKGASRKSGNLDLVLDYSGCSGKKHRRDIRVTTTGNVQTEVQTCP